MGHQVMMKVISSSDLVSDIICLSFPEFHITKLLLFNIPRKPSLIKVIIDILSCEKSVDLGWIDIQVLCQVNSLVSPGKPGESFSDHPVLDALSIF